MSRSNKRKTNFGKLVKQLSSDKDQLHFLQVLVWFKTMKLLFWSLFRTTIFSRNPSIVKPVVNILTLYILKVFTTFFIAKVAIKSTPSGKIHFLVMQIFLCVSLSFCCIFLYQTSGVTRISRKKLTCPVTVKVTVIVLGVKGMGEDLLCLAQQQFPNTSHFSGRLQLIDIAINFCL